MALNALVVGPAVFIGLLFSIAVGLTIARLLPDHHLENHSKDAIKLATAIVGTLSALALGLLVASAKTTYENASVELRASAARVILLDRIMRQYGPETERARDLLRSFVEGRLQTLKHEDAPTADGNLEDTAIEPVQEVLRTLSPNTNAQRFLQARALQISGEIAEAHWIIAESFEGSIPSAFVIVLVLWLCLLFATFGLLSPVNWTVLGILFASALSVAAAIFLIVDMDHPYRGVIHVSDEPVRSALQHLK